MKPSALTWVAITTLILLTVVIFVAMDMPFGWVFYLTTLGQAVLVYTVYRVLTDDYTTHKTFDDFYDDHPIGKNK
ncbi:MAG: hypothetical protein OQJ83_05745 [Altibacter sp.]|uniref:hypothetical protein n=1 Tax=Altibacter lentus TaxID=1223410 RepID=UPI00054FF1CA|nr:hypothetical protein [Altibacter lentus]MCW8980872.1 hypothetical protein [Altibacter sp.]